MLTERILLPSSDWNGSVVQEKKDKIVKSYNATCTMTTGNEHNSIIKVPSSSNFIITFNFEIVKLHTFSSDGRFLERRLIVSSYVSSLADFPYPGFCVYLGITSIRSWEKTNVINTYIPNGPTVFSGNYMAMIHWYTYRMFPVLGVRSRKKVGWPECIVVMCRQSRETPFCRGLLLTAQIPPRPLSLHTPRSE